MQSSTAKLAQKYSRSTAVPFCLCPSRLWPSAQSIGIGMKCGLIIIWLIYKCSLQSSYWPHFFAACCASLHKSPSPGVSAKVYCGLFVNQPWYQMWSDHQFVIHECSVCMLTLLEARLLWKLSLLCNSALIPGRKKSALNPSSKNLRRLKSVQICQQVCTNPTSGVWSNPRVK